MTNYLRAVAARNEPGLWTLHEKHKKAADAAMRLSQDSTRAASALKEVETKLRESEKYPADPELSQQEVRARRELEAAEAAAEQARERELYLGDLLDKALVDPDTDYEALIDLAPPGAPRSL